MTEHKESSVLARFASPSLILATIIWGSSFVVMKSSVDVLAHLLVAGHPLFFCGPGAGGGVHPAVEGAG
ncbi:MAG: hypothetical protein ACLRNQ_12310 [Flavonifractor plautii]